MNKVYLLLGSNLSNPLQQLQSAKNKIAKFAEVISESSVYETKAWGKTDQPDFLNQALYVATWLEPEEVLHEILSIEKSMGRIRTEKNAPRLIDIDILFYNSLTVEKKDLIIPHPQIAKRRFVLIPLNEIAPDYVHPLLGFTVAHLLENCTDPLQVKRY